VTRGRSDPANDVPAPFAEILHLNVTTDLFQLPRNVVSGSRSAGCTGLTSRARGIRKPRNVTLEAIAGNGGKRAEIQKERKQKRGKLLTLHEFEIRPSAVRPTTYAPNPTSNVTVTPQNTATTTASTEDTTEKAPLMPQYHAVGAPS